MTMILTLLGENWIIQASDRRLTHPSGQLFENHSNKALIWCADHVVGYTGLSQLGNIPTIDWLSSQIIKFRGYEETLAAAANTATGIVGRMNLRPSTKRVGFVIGGYAAVRGTESTRPVLTVLSNFIGNTGKVAPNAASSFSYHHQMLPEGQMLFFPVGPSLSRAHEEALRRAVLRAATRATSPFPIARLLVHALDRIAQRSTTVGRNIMCTILPRPQGPRSGTVSITSGMIPLTDDLRRRDAEYFRTPNDWAATPHYLYRAYDSPAMPSFGPALVCGDVAVKGIAFQEA